MATIPTESDRFGSSTQDNTAVVAARAVQQPQPESVLSEIPIIVHASHRSAAPGEAGKVHTVREETSTVLVFPRGGVVRLSSTLSKGDLVVLTNQQSRADMLCRVVYVREQPGGGGYVEFEFTQRSAAFWTQGPAGPRASATTSTLASTESSSVVPSSTPALATILPFPQTPRPLGSPTPPGASLTSPKEESSAPTAMAAVLTAPVSPDSATTSPAPPAAPTGEGDSEPITSAAREAFMRAEAADSPESWLASESETPAPASARGGFVAKLKELSHSRIIWVVGVALTIAAFFGESYLMGHRGPSNSAADVATSRAIYPMQQAAARTSEEHSSSDPITLDSISVISSTSPKGDSAENAGGNGSVNAQPRQNAIRIEKLAPIATTPSIGTSSEPPPVLPAQGANDADYLIGAGSLSGAAAAGGPAPIATTAAASAPATPPSNLQAPKMISSTAPVYPPFARAQGVAGTVVLDATIDETGKVTNATIVSGSPLLRQAALDAVRQWKYQPAELNGQPILSHATINVNFAR